MQFELNDEQLDKALQSAVLNLLTDESKEKLFAQAITNILEPGSTGYNKKSKFQDAFERAVFVAANKVAEDMLKNDPVIQIKIKEMISEAVELSFTEKRKETVENLARQIAHAFC